MNKLMIIGNLTRDPELRTTPSGANVCSFTVAVNRRTKGQEQADFFSVSAWNEMGLNASKYLAKGRKVAVVGPVSVRTYQGRDGKTYAQMEVMANDIEYLTPKSENDQKSDQMVAQATEAMQGKPGFTQVAEEDLEDLPF